MINNQINAQPVPQVMACIACTFRDCLQHRLQTFGTCTALLDQVIDEMLLELSRNLRPALESFLEFLNQH